MLPAARAPHCWWLGLSQPLSLPRAVLGAFPFLPHRRGTMALYHCRMIKRSERKDFWVEVSRQELSKVGNRASPLWLPRLCPLYRPVAEARQRGSRYHLWKCHSNLKSPAAPSSQLKKLFLQRHDVLEVSWGLSLRSTMHGQHAEKSAEASQNKMVLWGHLPCNFLLLCVLEQKGHWRRAVSSALLVNDTLNSLNFIIWELNILGDRLFLPWSCQRHLVGKKTSRSVWKTAHTGTFMPCINCEIN